MRNDFVLHQFISCRNNLQDSSFPQENKDMSSLTPAGKKSRSDGLYTTVYLSKGQEYL